MVLTGVRQTMTPAELKAKVTATGSNFFERKTLAFFGDTMRNYSVRSKPVMVETWSSGPVECWELVRKRAVKHGLCDSGLLQHQDFRARAYAQRSQEQRRTDARRVVSRCGARRNRGARCFTCCLERLRGSDRVSREQVNCRPTL